MKTVNIIGAGIAGLSAGCYLQMNGYKTRIFEMHNIPGGLCTSWKRKDYTFDGCIHWLVGSKPGSEFNKLWSEIIDINKLRFINPEVYVRIYDDKNSYIDIFTDADRLEKELLEKAPEDSRFINSMIKSIKKLSEFKMDPSVAPEAMSLIDGIKYFFKTLPYMPEFRKWNKRTKDITKNIKNPLLRSAFYNSFDPDMSFIFFLFTLAWMDQKDAGYPVGGSVNFAKKIEESYLDFGGEIFYNSRIEKILTEKVNKRERAHIVRTSKGEEFNSDITISAADGYSTIYLMLDGKFKDKKIDGYYENHLPFPSYFQVSLGVNDPLADTAVSQLFSLQKPIKADPETTFYNLHFRTFKGDHTVADENKNVITFMMPTRNYGYWYKLRKENYKQYLKEKNNILKQVIEELNHHIPGITEKIEVSDISTPASVIRYTSNWKGSYEGWILTPELGFRQIKKTLPGLEDFYMTGQWVEPGGGIPTVLRSGRNVAQLICKKDGKKFATKKSE